MRQFIESGPDLPQWTAPISHAVVVDNLCYLSGQLSLDPDGTFVDGTTAAQARRAFGNLFAAVRAAGFAPEELVFVDVALVDLADIGAINEIYAELFASGRRPARTVYQAAGLPYGGRVKVMGICVRERGG
jgi:2-iminobutanoate/2-iminopropanoate deaminase